MLYHAYQTQSDLMWGRLRKRKIKHVKPDLRWAVTCFVLSCAI